MRKGFDESLGVMGLIFRAWTLVISVLFLKRSFSISFISLVLCCTLDRWDSQIAKLHLNEVSLQLLGWQRNMKMPRSLSSAEFWLSTSFFVPFTLCIRLGSLNLEKLWHGLQMCGIKSNWNLYFPSLFFISPLFFYNWKLFTFHINKAIIPLYFLKIHLLSEAILDSKKLGVFHYMKENKGSLHTQKK